MSNRIKQFTELYFAAEKRANPHDTSTGLQLNFRTTDKQIIATEVNKLITDGIVGSVKDIVNKIIYYSGRSMDYSKHYNRLTSWTKNTNFTGLVEKPTVKPAFPEGPPPVFKVNLEQSIKSWCKAGIKNKLNTNDMLEIYKRALEEANREINIELNDSKLKAFLRENNISKDLAIDIIEAM